MKACPVNRQWIHSNLLEPFLQGTELINLAWEGKDHALVPNTLSLKNRIIYWLQGTILLTPLVNIIIWIAWQTFGKPQALFDPFSPELDIPKPQPQVIYHPEKEPAPVAGPPPASHIRQPETFVFDENIGKEFVYSTNWRIEHFPDMTVVQQFCDRFTCTSVYSPDQTIKGFHHLSANRKLDIVLIDPKHVRVRFQDDGVTPYDQTIELTENIPWIQHPIIGFRNFVLSDQNKMSFYGIMPNNPMLDFFPFLPVTKPPLVMKVNVTKVGIEEVPGFGPLQKLEVVSDWGWPYNSRKGELWFDPQTAQLRVFKNPITNMSGTFARNSQLPE